MLPLNDCDGLNEGVRDGVAASDVVEVPVFDCVGIPCDGVPLADALGLVACDDVSVADGLVVGVDSGDSVELPVAVNDPVVVSLPESLRDDEGEGVMEDVSDLDSVMVDEGESDALDDDVDCTSGFKDRRGLKRSPSDAW